MALKKIALCIVGLWIVISPLVACEKAQESAPASPQAEPAYRGTIVAMGDSLTEGLGVDEEDAYPARLQKKLFQEGKRYKVVNAGISGETSSGALSRIDWVLTLEPDIVILETGANDGLRGIDPALTRDNIDKIIQKLHQENVVVVLAGMEMMRNLGEPFTRAFGAIYPELAKAHDVILIPFFLEGVAGNPKLNQTDGVHPTAKGYQVVTETVYPYVVEAIEKVERAAN
jgi:acyl-CoA thioesterase-1